MIRPFQTEDAEAVRSLFIEVNRLFAPPYMADAFEAYIADSLEQEIDRIPQYYTGKEGQFWVVLSDSRVVGMFGLEPSGPGAMELRRMYVDPDFRRRGIAQEMMRAAEDYCLNTGQHRLDLSTSEIQFEALAFYRQAGYELVREEVADETSNKTIGGGIRRYYFEKQLHQGQP